MLGCVLWTLPIYCPFYKWRIWSSETLSSMRQWLPLRLVETGPRTTKACFWCPCLKETFYFSSHIVINMLGRSRAFHTCCDGQVELTVMPVSVRQLIISLYRHHSKPCLLVEIFHQSLSATVIPPYCRTPEVISAISQAMYPHTLLSSSPSPALSQPSLYPLYNLCHLLCESLSYLDGSVLKSMSCSCQGPEFSCQHPR